MMCVTCIIYMYNMYYQQLSSGELPCMTNISSIGVHPPVNPYPLHPHACGCVHRVG